MKPAQLRAILALPFNVLVVVPALILAYTGGFSRADPAHPAFWLGLACLGGGVTLMVLTIRLFHTVGQGTLAPWDPTQRLVVVGVYRHVRNPMISGVLLDLLGLACLFRSAGIAAWFAVFFAANALYLPLSEERGLEARFGEDYRRYKAAVPRWIPRWRAWEG